jgi:glucose/mannose transport system substrate-binding protein
VVQIDDPARVPELISRAFHVATSGRPGPVVVALPEDMLTSQTDTRPLTGSARIAEPAPEAGALAEALHLISKAKRPAILLGGCNWTEAGKAALQAFAKVDGNWVSAPVNVHSTNWVWANTALMAELGISQPTSWEEFVAAMEAAKAAGKTALAHGGQAWQEATMFDSMVMGAGGPDFYQAALVDLDPAALGSDTMVEAFNRMATLRSFVDDNFSGRDWNLATAMVINGDALFQIMGDWAKGEFVNAGMTAGNEFTCFRVPGTEGTVTFNSDQFAMFNVTDASAQQAQAAMASAVLSPEFQVAFNLVKGSVPARTDIPSDQFDMCGQMGMAQLAEAGANGGLFGSMAHGHANPPSVQNAMYDVITAHFNGEYDAATAAAELVTAVEIAQ